MDSGLFIVLSVSTVVIVLLSTVAVKIAVSRQFPANPYTPFDYINDPSSADWQEEENDSEDPHGKAEKEEAPIPD